MAGMTSSKPYLVRAIHEWICDNGCTTYIAVHVDYPGVEVPQDYVMDGQIILNVAPRAVQGFIVDNDRISFSARFGGRPVNVSVPIGAVMAVYARENGQGMTFDVQPPPVPPEPSGPRPVEDSASSAEKPSGKSNGGKASLRVVK